MSFYTKTEIRRSVRKAIATLSEGERISQSAQIVSHIASLEEVQHAKVVALFASLADEPQTADFIQWAATHKYIVLPRIDGDDMDFYPYSPESMQRGAFGIEEPQTEERTDPAEIDLIIVPGRAFTPQGKRLGRGRGYYDRYMSQSGFHATKIGVCYKEQLVEEIPDEPHDILMECVIYA